MALARLRVCAGWSEPLLVAHNTLLEISRRGSYIYITLVAHYAILYIYEKLKMTGCLQKE